MKTSYEYFKGLGCKELPYDKLPEDYLWITGCGGDGWYWNFFMKEETLLVKNYFTDDDNKKVIMCKIKKL